MKSQNLTLLLVVIGSVYVTNAWQNLKNIDQCNKGPANWCENIINAKRCKAVRHCIQTVWEKQDVPDDDDSICNICLDMVKQARDQLQSNETQNDLKAVFEGSCKLIVLKPVVEECTKLVDNFIPELVEALSSQMNPQVVCSVAGLCNNVKIDKLLESYKANASLNIPSLLTSPVASKVIAGNYEHKILSCEECGLVSSIISTKFKIVNRDELLDSILNLCGYTGSFSDACANIALTYFKTLYDFLTSKVGATSICHISGTCVAKYHQHANDTKIQGVRVLPSNDDIPCELCQQLVHHFQEVLTANTTELEFKQVLEGLCRQTKGFKAECLSIVDQYYDKIYQTLVNNLDANGACFLIGICPKGSADNFLSHKDLKPLIPYIESAKVDIQISKLDKSTLPVYTKEQVNSMQLPIDLLTLHKSTLALDGNAELCTLCEFFLHFLQETLATPATEEKIKDTVVHLCRNFPNSLKENCHNFVDMYGDAVIALMIQGINPREMCPRMDLCPKISGMESIATIPIKSNSNSTCPMCLFAVQQAQELIRDDKSKKNIKTVLDTLCSHLSGKIKNECVDFVETYSNELIDMLITDFTPQQVCVYLKLCSSDQKSLDWVNINIDDEALIDDLFSKEDLSSQIEEESINNPECLLCEKVISEVEKKIGPAKTKEDIEKELYKACSQLKKLSNKCQKYVDEYGDKIAALILLEMSPKQICKELGYCSWKKEANRVSEDQINNESKGDAKSNNFDPQPCVLCEFIIKQLENKIKDKKTEEEIKQEVENICKVMPQPIAGHCDKFIEKYGDLIIAMVETVPPKEICKKLGLCPMQQSYNKRTVDPQKCILCETIVKQLENQLIGKKTTEQIKLEVEHICQILPDSIKVSCNQFIEKYGNTVVDLLLMVQPKEICQRLEICSAFEGRVHDEIVECGVCHGATTRLLTYVNDNEYKTSRYQTMIETVCNDLPGRYYKKCSNLLKIYGKSIRNLLDRKIDHSKICAKIGKCFAEEDSYNSYVKII